MTTAKLFELIEQAGFQMVLSSLSMVAKTLLTPYSNIHW